MNSIKEWLNKIGHEEYLQRFTDSKINMDVLPDLTEEDLEKLDIPLGDRKRIMRAISALVARPADGAGAVRPAPPGVLSEAPSSNVAEPGQLRHLTVCFVDLVGSTALSAELDLEDRLRSGYVAARAQRVAANQQLRCDACQPLEARAAD